MRLRIPGGAWCFCCRPSRWGSRSWQRRWRRRPAPRHNNRRPLAVRRHSRSRRRQFRPRFPRVRRLLPPPITGAQQPAQGATPRPASQPRRRGLYPSGTTPRGLHPRGLHPRGLHPKGLPPQGTTRPGSTPQAGVSAPPPAAGCANAAAGARVGRTPGVPRSRSCCSSSTK